MKRVLLLNPRVRPPGGGDSVAAWAIEALRGRYDVQLLAFEAPDLAEVNEYYGTRLAPGDFTFIQAANPVRWLRLLPMRLALVRLAALQAAARRLIPRLDPDVVVGFYGEMDVGRPAIQYVHYPTLFDPRSDADRWYHLPPLVWLYRRAALRLGGVSVEGARGNLTLANSAFTARAYARAHGVEPAILHPPVPHAAPPQAWDERPDVFVCAGRISREKRIEAAIEVLAEVRRRGYDVRLHVVGDVDQTAYARRLEPLYARHAWVHVEGRLSRADYAELLSSSRYAIHGMHEEHFGIAVAELQRAGCVVFARDSGGPTEILGGDTRLLAKDDADMLEKIVRVLDDAGLQRELHAEALARGAAYSVERFSRELLAHLEAFQAGGHRPR